MSIKLLRVPLITPVWSRRLNFLPWFTRGVCLLIFRGDDGLIVTMSLVIELCISVCLLLAGLGLHQGKWNNCFLELLLVCLSLIVLGKFHHRGTTCANQDGGLKWIIHFDLTYIFFHYGQRAATIGDRLTIIHWKPKWSMTCVRKPQEHSSGWWMNSTL